MSCSTHNGYAGHRQIICIPEDIFALFQANIPGNGEPKGKTPLVRILPPLANKYHRDSLSMFTLKTCGIWKLQARVTPVPGFANPQAISIRPVTTLPTHQLLPEILKRYPR